MNYVTVMQLRNLIPNIKIIDIRDNYQYQMENIPTSKNIPTNFLLTNPEVYLNHLGCLNHYKRCPMIEAGTLYYTKRDEVICFYDKVHSLFLLIY